jgi:phage baseplate assembly protein W
MAQYFGFNPPFLQRSVSGTLNVLPRQFDDRLIRNDLLQLLLTSPGERMYRPDFGSPIRETLFGPITDQDLETLRRGIEEAIGKYDRRVTVTKVDIRSEPDQNTITIKIFGYFNYDRFNRPEAVGSLSDTDLLIQLQLPTSKTPELV